MRFGLWFPSLGALLGTLLNLIEIGLSRWIALLEEGAQAIVLEAWRTAFRTINFIASASLSLLHRPSLETWRLDHRRRFNVHSSSSSVAMMAEGASWEPPLDAVFRCEGTYTGAVEDLKVVLIASVHAPFDALQRVRRSLFWGLRSRPFWFWPVELASASVTQAAIAVSSIAHVVGVVRARSARNGPRIRTLEQAVTDQGYPYARLEVTTADGVRLGLERLPRLQAKHVVYLQHGIFDTARAWFDHAEGEANTGLAFRAFDAGYDVFAGTFRGADGTWTGQRPGHGDAWDFSVNDHGLIDVPAFLRRITETKTMEGVPGAKIHAIAHSMGAMALLMYLIDRRVRGRPHDFASAILLAPAGLHRHLPTVLQLLGQIAFSAMVLTPRVRAIAIPASTQVLVAKLIQDAKRSFFGRTVLRWATAIVLGGRTGATIVDPRAYASQLFTCTSANVIKHFKQIVVAGEFVAYDYGRRDKNRAAYPDSAGVPTNFGKLYHLLNIPIYFVASFDDRLIPIEDVSLHYQRYRRANPHLAHFKAFSGLGHADFTVGASQDLVLFMIDTLSKLSACE